MFEQIYNEVLQSRFGTVTLGETFSGYCGMLTISLIPEALLKQVEEVAETYQLGDRLPDFENGVVGGQGRVIVGIDLREHKIGEAELKSIMCEVVEGFKAVITSPNELKEVVVRDSQDDVRMNI